MVAERAERLLAAGCSADKAVWAVAEAVGVITRLPVPEVQAEMG